MTDERAGDLKFTPTVTSIMDNSKIIADMARAVTIK